MLYTATVPQPVKQPKMMVFNDALACEMGFHPQDPLSPEWARLLSGNDLPTGATPIAQAYAGHQYGHFTKLGDGRAILLGEKLTPDGRWLDIQLKGSGPTAYSRRGDGRAALGPMLREYLISEAMAALRISTTRSLAVVTTGETVMREAPLPSAILTRIASSHIRVGTFEYARAFGDVSVLKALADYAIERHYPSCQQSNEPYLSFLAAVINQQAKLIAQWQGVGFIHGVMNTDNMSISGETIDYGPCAFMDSYHPETVYSFIDRDGRYAYHNQPNIGLWNVTRLAEALLPLLDLESERAIEKATTCVQSYSSQFQTAWDSLMAAKLGLPSPTPSSQVLAQSLFQCMKTHSLDMTNTYQALTQWAIHTQETPSFETKLKDEIPDGFEHLAKNFPDYWLNNLRPLQQTGWLQQWQTVQRQEGVTPTERVERLRYHNPVVIPRNHCVEEALTAASNHADFSLFHLLLHRIQKPFLLLPQDSHHPKYLLPPKPNEAIQHTYCGT